MKIKPTTSRNLTNRCRIASQLLRDIASVKVTGEPKTRAALRAIIKVLDAVASGKAGPNT